ncbi:klaroid protein-like [Hetaerina americana]|uniref:klaroid protein-like n=1 Tax=Hetaerina americana TaxID=62018 RepID=UPI003A7F4FE9
MGEENIATGRASRSRSRTPFLRSSCDRELCNSSSGTVHSHKVQLQYEHSLIAVAKSKDEGKSFSFKYSDTAFGTASVTGAPRVLRKKKSETRKTCISPAKTLNQINGVYRTSNEKDANSRVNKIESQHLTDGKTSDYSSEGENISQDPYGAFQLYKRSGDWWNVFPKTDYTYSEYSPHRKEIAPGIVNMPNMSRLGLHNQDLMSPTQNIMKQSMMQKFSSYERSKSSSYSVKQGGEQYDRKWARVLGAEYTSNESIRPDNSSTNDTYILTKMFSVIMTYIVSVTSWISRSTSFLKSDDIYSGYKTENRFSRTLQERFIQLIYHVLGYVKFVDTWLLLGWSKGITSSYSTTHGNYYQRLFARLMKVFLLFLPTILIAGCWAYVHIWDDQAVSNSISIPEPNEPLLTSHSKSALGSAIQDFGAFSPLKILATSFASNLHILWMWIMFPVIKNGENEDKQVVGTIINPPAPVIQSSEKWKMKAEECASSAPKVNMDELVSNIIVNPLFMNVLSSTKGEDSSLKIDNILLKMDHMQQQIDQKSSEIDMLKNRMKSDVEWHINAFSKESRERNDAVLEKLNQLVMRIDELSTQHQFLENLIHIESSSREKAILELREILTVLKKQDSLQPSLQISNECNNHENFNQFKLDLMKYVDDQFTKYDADKTGLPDYALETSGGSIVSTRCTETYQAKTAVFSLFGIPLWSPSINPRKIIQPGILPGECWAFKGSQGYVVIKLSKKVHITRFSLEHTPKSLSPVGTIDSAPRNFSVWGLKNEMDMNGQLFGQYVFDQNGPSLQYFSVKEPDLPPFQFIELRIESNHGNLEYTCVYRFRVHGNMHREENDLYGQHGN